MNNFHHEKHSAKVLMFAMMLLMTVAAMAQTKVSGFVSDAGKEPIIGASVLEKGTTNGTVTDFDGKFELNVLNNQATLVVSYVGMKAQDRKSVV